MRKLAKGMACMALALSLMAVNGSNVIAANKSMTYSDLMEEEVIEKGATDNVDVEAEEIFGSEKATTTIDSNTKKSDSKSKKEASNKTSDKTLNKSTQKETVKEVPKTGMEDTPLYLPVVFLVFAFVAAVCAGVKIVGAKKIRN